MQNVTDLLRILGLGMIVPNKSDALNIESDCRPHSSSDPPDGGPPSPRGKAWRLRRIFTTKSEFESVTIPSGFHLRNDSHCTVHALAAGPCPLNRNLRVLLFTGNMKKGESYGREAMFSQENIGK